MDLGLTDRAFVVTAASTGLGRATAQQLVAEGARVVLVARRAELLAEAVSRLGPDRAVALAADLDRCQHRRDGLRARSGCLRSARWRADQRWRPTGRIGARTPARSSGAARSSRCFWRRCGSAARLSGTAQPSDSVHRLGAVDLGEDAHPGTRDVERLTAWSGHAGQATGRRTRPAGDAGGRPDARCHRDRARSSTSTRSRMIRRRRGRAQRQRFRYADTADRKSSAESRPSCSPLPRPT